MQTATCISGSIAPFVPDADRPWDTRRIQHLYRRMGFGATLEQIELARLLSPQELVDQLIDQALAEALGEDPEWADWAYSDFDNPMQIFEKFNEMRTQWLLTLQQGSFREKMALFWSNHLVIQYEAIPCVTQTYTYVKLLRSMALGNFRTLVYEMGKNPAMLIYLNGAQSFLDDPNENYARELYELFTLGRDNGYTQEDIAETARALTGWTFPEFLANRQNICTTAVDFVEVLWDKGEKTIFGQTGNWGYDEVHEILFTQRANEIAQHICGKLYRQFVYPEVDPVIVDALAQTFLANDFELVPVLRQLFSSEHFFDDSAIGTQFKSPIEFQLSLTHELGMNIEEIGQFMVFAAMVLGQELLNPTDVAGWPGHRAWISTDKLTYRWQVTDFLLLRNFGMQAESFRSFAKDLSGDATDPALIARAIVDFFMPNGFQTEADYERATLIFKGEVPQNYYDRGLWNLDWDSAPFQVGNLIYRLSRYPEFQMM